MSFKPQMGLSVKGFELRFVLFRWNGRTRSSVADRNLPQWEEWGDVQSAGCRQHGWGLLHASYGYGALPYHLCLWTPLLLEAEILLHRGLHWQARPTFLHQSGEDPFAYLTYFCFLVSQAFLNLEEHKHIVKQQSWICLTSQLRNRPTRVSASVCVWLCEYLRLGVMRMG